MSENGPWTEIQIDKRVMSHGVASDGSFEPMEVERISEPLAVLLQRGPKDVRKSRLGFDLILASRVALDTRYCRILPRQQSRRIQATPTHAGQVISLSVPSCRASQKVGSNETAVIKGGDAGRLQFPSGPP
jgi:hypothetical protein